MRARRVAKRLPHVHHRQTDAMAFLVSQRGIELRHAGFRAILPAEPDRAMPDQVAHDDAVGVSLLDRDFVDANRLRPRRARFGQLRRHVLLLQRLDGLPVQMELLGHILDRRRPAAPSDVMGKALGIEGIAGQEVELLAFHFAAMLAVNPPHVDSKVDPAVAARQIANLPRALVVPAKPHTSAAATLRFFERRTRSMMHACESPKIPRTTGCARNPGTVYASVSRRFRLNEVAIQTCCQLHAPCETPDSQYPCGFQADSHHQFTHSLP